MFFMLMRTFVLNRYSLVLVVVGPSRDTWLGVHIILYLDLRVERDFGTRCSQPLSLCEQVPNVFTLFRWL